MRTPAWQRLHLRPRQRAVSTIPQQAKGTASICQGEAWGALSPGTPASLKLAASAISASITPRNSDLLRSRKMGDRGNTTLLL